MYIDKYISEYIVIYYKSTVCDKILYLEVIETFFVVAFSVLELILFLSTKMLFL